MSKVVEIEKNGRKKTVPYAAFRNFFVDSGWKIIGEEQSSPVFEEEPIEENPVEEMNVETSDEETDDEVADEEWEEAENELEVEKPLSEMTRSELVAKAESLGVEAKGNNAQLREAIKKAM